MNSKFLVLGHPILSLFNNTDFIKRILLVTETPPGTPNGFGVTLQNLFSNIKHDVLYTDISFKKSVKGLPYIHGHCPYHKSKKGFILFLLGLVPEWRGYYTKLWMFFFLRKKYDLVYAFFYSIDLAKFACWIATQKKADLIVHIADHSASFINNCEFIRILNQSIKLCCIGNNMKDYYETFFNKTFDVFHNLADDSYLPLSNTVNCSFNKSNPLKILFIGSLFKSLHDGTINIFCRAIDELNEEGYSINFSVYGQLVPNHFLKKEFSSPNVNHYGTIPSEQRFTIMSFNHCFLVPSSFCNNTKKEYCYSIPTKLPELLLSSRPVIVLGPKEMEAFRFCNENNCGILIDDNSIESIKSKIIDLLLNFSRYNVDSMKTSQKLFSQLSISSQGNKFLNFVLN